MTATLSSNQRLLDVKHCAGCRDDFYNDHNPYGVKACWMRKDAKLVYRLLIHVDRAPPYDREREAVEVPNCYRRERHVTVNPLSITAAGYWK